MTWLKISLDKPKHCLFRIILKCRDKMTVRIKSALVRIKSARIEARGILSHFGTRFPFWDKFPIWMLRGISAGMWPYTPSHIAWNKKDI